MHDASADTRCFNLCRRAHISSSTAQVLPVSPMLLCLVENNDIQPWLCSSAFCHHSRQRVPSENSIQAMSLGHIDLLHTEIVNTFQTIILEVRPILRMSTVSRAFRFVQQSHGPVRQLKRDQLFFLNLKRHETERVIRQCTAIDEADSSASDS